MDSYCYFGSSFPLGCLLVVVFPKHSIDEF